MEANLALKLTIYASIKIPGDQKRIRQPRL